MYPLDRYISQVGLLAPFSDVPQVILYELRRGEAELKKGAVLFSIDVDVGHEDVGVRNQGRNDTNVSDIMSERQVGKIEQMALPLILDSFDNFEIPVTLALRGQLFDVSPATAQAVISRSGDYDIGVHGYYHKSFAKLTHQEALREFEMLREAMQNFRLEPKSFVFPRNAIAHLDLLRAFDYLCFRGMGGFARNLMHVERTYGLWNVHPTAFVHSRSNILALRRVVDISLQRKLPAHLWFHPWNFGSNSSDVRKHVDNVLSPLLAHIRRLDDEGRIAVSTMKGIAEHVVRYTNTRKERL